MRRVIFMLATVAVTSVAGLSGSASAGHTDENAVVYWNGIATQTVLANSATATPSASSLYVAIVQAAVYDAVMAIEGTHAPYASAPDAPAGASLDAAVAAAAYTVLCDDFPCHASPPSTLDTAYAAALADVPDGPAETDGVTVGEQAAETMIDLRADDGRFAAVPAPADGEEAGEWRRTTPGAAAVTPWTAQVTPFLMESPDQFRPDGPNALTSKRYAAEFEETRLYGAKTGSLRLPKQTEIAQFWTENTLGQYNRALRRLATERELSNAESARLLAMTSLTGADAMITCWNTKYHYLAWRPLTAIRLADDDGNDATTADPAWEPLSTTANHPEYTSGHACLTGAISYALRRFLGTKQIAFKMDSLATGTTEHEFATVADLRREVENARIYGGDHFRTGGAEGTEAGSNVAKWALKRYFRKT